MRTFEEIEKDMELVVTGSEEEQALQKEYDSVMEYWHQRVNEYNNYSYRGCGVLCDQERGDASTNHIRPRFGTQY